MISNKVQAPAPLSGRDHFHCPSLSAQRGGRDFQTGDLGVNPAPPRAGCVAAGNLTTPLGLGFLSSAVGVLTAASEPRVSGVRGQADQAGLVSMPSQLHWMSGQPHLPSWHLEGGAALGWWGPREGRGHLPSCARCHPQAAHRTGAPRALPTPPPAPRQAFQALQSSASGLGSSSCGSLALWDRKDMLCPRVQQPICAHRLGSETGHTLHARRCTPNYYSPPSNPHSRLNSSSYLTTV